MKMIGSIILITGLLCINLIFSTALIGQIINEYHSIPSYRTVDNKIYFFGGKIRDGATYYNADDTIRVYDIITETWSVLEFYLPYEIFDYTNASYYDNHFYLSPGFSSGNTNGWGSHNSIIEVDLLNETASEVIVYDDFTRIWNIANITVGDYVYYIGGHNGTDQSGIYRYDPILNTLVKVSNLLSRKNIIKLIHGNNRMIYILGENSTVEIFNPSTNEVTALSSTIPASFTYSMNPLCWHIPTRSEVYFFSNGENPTLFKMNYATDVIEELDIILTGNFSYQSIQDSEDPYVIYVFQYNEDNDYVLTKLDLRDYVDFTSVIINENELGIINVYPNPTHSILKINGLTSITGISVYTITGKKLMEFDTMNTNSSIDLSYLENGIFISKLLNSNLTYSEIIIKK